MMKQLALRQVLLAAVLVPALSIAAKAQMEMPPTPVGFTAAIEHEVRSAISLTGTVESRRESLVAAEVAGVVVQLAVQEEVQKERLSRIWENGHVDDEVCRRLYGHTRDELLQAFRSEHPLSAGHLSLAEWTEFTYWLFRYRVGHADPARVASDTRKGVALLGYLEARARRAASFGLR